jgi:hypothetical protein
MKNQAASHYIPIYGSTVMVVATDNIRAAHNKPEMLEALHSDPIDFDCYGLTSRHNNLFVIFYQRSGLSHDTVAHEIFHVTHRIGEFLGIKLDGENHEALAYLNGHLTGLVYGSLKKWKVKIQ